MPRGDAGVSRPHRRRSTRATTRSSACRTATPCCARPTRATRSSPRDASMRAGSCSACRRRSRTSPPTEGLRTTFGSPLLNDHVPAYDALMVAAHEGGRLHRHRQDQHARVRPRLAHLQRGLRRHPQRLRPDEVGRRQQRRRRRGAGDAHAAGGRRQRLHGQPAQPGRLEQRLRLPAEPGPGAALAGAGRLGDAAQHRRADGRAPCATSPRCSTCRPATTRARRSRSPPSRRSRRASTPSIRAARASAGSATSAATWRWSRASSSVCERGLRRIEALGGTVEPMALGFAPERVWDAWLVWRRWIVAARIAPFLEEPGESRADQARGALGIRPGPGADRHRR